MGLDMYLYRNLDPNGNVLRVTPHDEFNSDSFAKLLERATKSSESYLYPTISVNIAYWRKANAIHQWFVAHCGDGVDECQDIDVSLDDLRKLKDICKSILEAPNDIDLMESLLPPQDGFFFGGTDLKDRDTINAYLDDVRYTNDMLSEEFRIVDEFNKYKIPSRYNPEKNN